MRKSAIRWFYSAIFIFLWSSLSHAGPISGASVGGSLPSVSTAQKANIAVPVDLSQPPTLGSNCGAQSTVVGTDNAGVITIGPVAEGSWNLGCTLTFDQPFQTPACVLAVSGAQMGNGIRIVHAKSDSLLFHGYPNKLQGGETVMYLCEEANTAPATAVPPVRGGPFLFSSGPSLGSNCGAQSAVTGTNGAGVITIGPVAEGSWNLGCTLNFAPAFKKPACVMAVSGGAMDNDLRIAQTKPDSILFHGYPNKFQGGESVMYLCTEAAP